MGRCAQCSRPAFFSVLDDTSASIDVDSWLALPTAFTQLYGAHMGTQVTIHGPDDVPWLVTLKGQSLTTVGFRNGWGGVVDAYGMKPGDLVVLRLVEESTFKVEVFGGRTRLGKHPEAEKKKKKKQLPRTPVSRPSTSSAPRDISVTIKDHVALLLERSSKGERGSVYHDGENGYNATTPRSKRGRPRSRSLGDVPDGRTKRKRLLPPPSAALRKAQQFKSENPCHTAVMKESHVVKVFYMGIASDFAKRCLPRVKCRMVLLDDDGNGWNTTWIGDKPAPGISAGWNRFARDHALETGDVCVFEVKNPSKTEVKVHIFRLSVCEWEEKEERASKEVVKDEALKKQMEDRDHEEWMKNVVKYDGSIADSEDGF